MASWVIVEIRRLRLAPHVSRRDSSVLSRTRQICGHFVKILFFASVKQSVGEYWNATLGNCTPGYHRKEFQIAKAPQKIGVNQFPSSFFG